MTRVPKEYSEHFRALDQLRVITEQENTVELFADLQVQIERFWDACAAARQAFLSGERELSIQDAAFRALISNWGDALLMYVAAAQREKLRRAAARDAARLATNWGRRLGDIEVIAHADLELRVLMVAVLEVMSKAYKGETRLPAWDRMIDGASAEIEAACDEWQKLAETM